MTATKLDLTGLKCPLPALKTRKALKALKPGDDSGVCFIHQGRPQGRSQLAMTNGDTTSRSRGALRPRFAGKCLTLQSEGAGNAGRPMRPIAACAEVVVESTRVSQVTPESPGTPRAMVLTVYNVLSPATGLSCHRRLARLLARLDASVGASGPHAFSVRLKRFRQRRHPRPPHPRPALMTLRNAPLSGTGWQVI